MIDTSPSSTASPPSGNLLFLVLAALAMMTPIARAEPAPEPASGLSPAELRCEYRAKPLGIDVAQPRLSWIVTSPERGQKQTAYRVLVAASPEALGQDQGELWDSGQVQSGETAAIVYAGKPLTSHQHCFWKVKVWDKDGTPSAWSSTAAWSMGLLNPSNWKAEWIGYDAPRNALKAGAGGANLVLPPPAYLRTTFPLSRPVKHATVYTTALGIHDLYLNGRRVSDDSFNPGWTDYTRRVYSRAYDVTDQLRQGENALGAILADGWYSGYVGFGKLRDHYGKHPRLKAQLHIEYDDGSTDTVATGPTWKAATGPISEADFLMGETYDARAALSGWDTPGFDDSRWAAVVTGSEVHPVVQAHPGPPVLPFAELKPKAITEPKPGAYVLDMGQNFAGVPRLSVRGEPGQKITLRFAERLNPDGTIYTTNLRGSLRGYLHLRGPRRGNLDPPVHVPRLPVRGDHRAQVSPRAGHADRHRPLQPDSRRRPVPLLRAHAQHAAEQLLLDPAPTSSTSPRTVPSATSAWAGPATPRSISARPR